MYDWIADIRAAIESWYFSDDIDFQTSGSSGVPKVLRFTKAQIEASARRTLAYVGEVESATLVLPASFTGGKMLIYRAILAQIKLYCYKPALELPLDMQGDMISVSPVQWQKNTLDSFSVVLIGGGVLEADFQARSPRQRVFHTYGMTETLSNIAMRVPGSEDYEVLEGVRFDRNDEQCLVIWDSVTGVEGLATQDRVEKIDDTHFRFLGRTDRVVNSGGKKIHLNDWMQKWQSISDMEVQVVGEKDQLWGEMLVLLCLQDVEKVEWIRLFSQLERHCRPRRVYRVEQWATTSSGKQKTFLQPKDISELAARIVYDASL